ncbi:MAG: hypothetical protein H7138_24055 [Myxococcales bacterium]|nr:hypothetical protein [Myxococcales bacterium]
MTKKPAIANPAGQDGRSLGNPPGQGNEPGQDQENPRRDRQNTGSAAGTNTHSKNQGRQEGQGQNRDSRSEKGDARRTSTR